MTHPTRPSEPPQNGAPARHANAAVMTQVLNTVVSVTIIGAVTFLAADHLLQVGTVSAIFVTLIAHQFGSFTIGRRSDDPPH